MIFSCCSIAAVITIIPYPFMDRIDVPLKIGFLCCFVITFTTWVSVYTMNFTNMLEQVSLLIGSKITLVTFKLFITVNVFYMSFQVWREGGFKFTCWEGTLVHWNLWQRLSSLLQFNIRIKHYCVCVYLPRFIFLKWKHKLKQTPVSVLQRSFENLRSFEDFCPKIHLRLHLRFIFRCRRIFEASKILGRRLRRFFGKI